MTPSKIRAQRPGRYIHAAYALALGLATGVIIRLLDMHTENAGNIFSQLSVWILICTALAVFSANPRLAALKAFAFCAGMLVTYYLTAQLTGGVWSMSFALGWAAVSLVALPAGYIAWYARGSGAIAMAIGAGIIAVMLAAEWLLFDRLRVSDLFCAAACALVVFYRKK